MEASKRDCEKHVECELKITDINNLYINFITITQKEEKSLYSVSHRFFTDILNLVLRECLLNTEIMRICFKMAFSLTKVAHYNCKCESVWNFNEIYTSNTSVKEG